MIGPQAAGRGRRFQSSRRARHTDQERPADRSLGRHAGAKGGPRLIFVTQAALLTMRPNADNCKGDARHWLPGGDTHTGTSPHGPTALSRSA